MRTLITGGAGFIGSHLAEALLDAGHRVMILDNLSTGSIENIRHLKERPGFEYRVDSVDNEPLLAELIDGADVVFHLAAAVGVKLIVEQPVHTIETNVHGTEVVLKHASKKKKLVVVASTSEVYGKSDRVPFSEDSDLVMGPTTKHRWAYACSKAIDEFLALAYWKERKLPVIVVRFFNTVGPRQTGQYGMVIPNFVQQALAGEPITVFGDGTQSRAFTHVADVVRALIALMNEPAAIGQVINIGSTEEVTMRELAERVRTLTGSSSAITLIPYDEAYESGFEDMPRRLPDLTKIHRMIGYEPHYTLNGILTDVIQHFRGQSPYTGSMRHALRLLFLAGALSWASTASAEVRLSMAEGRVSISAQNATVSQILAEWARVGQTRIVNGERLAGGPMTIELTNMPEAQALDILLRNASGYLLAPRAAASPTASKFDRVLILPTSSAPRMATPPPPSYPPPRPQMNMPEEDDVVPRVDRPAFVTFPQPGVPRGNGAPSPVQEDAPPPPSPSPMPTAPVGVARPGMIVPMPAPPPTPNPQ